MPDQKPYFGNEQMKFGHPGDVAPVKTTGLVREGCGIVFFDVMDISWFWLKWTALQKRGVWIARGNAGLSVSDAVA